EQGGGCRADRHRRYDIPMSYAGRRAALVCVLGLIAQAVLLPQRAPQSSAIPTSGAISGTVVDAATGQSLARARVTLTSPAIRNPRVTITGADGAFHFERLAPGAYAVAASRRGYVERPAGGVESNAPSGIVLSTGQRVAGRISLEPAGVLAGRV